MNIIETASIRDMEDPRWWRHECNDLYFFCSVVLSQAWPDKFHDFSPLQQSMCQFLTPAHSPSKKRLMAVYRESLKTTVLLGLCEWLFSWYHYKQEPTAINYNTATEENAIAFMNDFRYTLINCPLLHAAFNLPSNKEAYDSWTKKSVRLGHVRFNVSSFEEQQASRHAKIIINDDLVNEKNYWTEASREEIKRKWRYQKSVSSQIKLTELSLEYDVGTPYHYQDLMWELMTKNKTYEKFIVACVSGWPEISVSDIINRTRPLSNPELMTYEKLMEKLEEQQTEIFTCTPKETPVLMADWSLKPISEITSGEYVLGIKRGAGPKIKSTLVPSKVLNTFKRKDQVFDLLITNGDTIKCTKDHRWFTGRPEGSGNKYSGKRGGSGHKCYLPAKVGSKLSCLLRIEKETDPQKLYAWNYLGGIIDGEGACKYSGIFVHQSPRANPEVYKKIKETLDYLGIKYSSNFRPRYSLHTLPGGNEIKTNEIDYFYLLGGKQLWFDVIRYSSLAKKQQLVNKMYRHNYLSTTRPRVFSIIPEKVRDVYALETETGNYVAWGYVSGNSQYCLKPLNEMSALCQKSWIKYWERLPATSWRTLVFDPGGSEPGISDPTGVTVVDCDPAGNLYVVCAEEIWIQPTNLVETILDYIKRYKPDDTRIERDLYTKTCAEVFQHEFPKYNIVYVDHHHRPKPDRIWQLRQWFMRGRVYIHPNQKILEDQLLQYPQITHDDVLDSLAYHLDILHVPKEVERPRFEPQIEPGFDKEFNEYMEGVRSKSNQGVDYDASY
jgi:hypothetical protein